MLRRGASSILYFGQVFNLACYTGPVMPFVVDERQAGPLLGDVLSPLLPPASILLPWTVPRIIIY